MKKISILALSLIPTVAFANDDINNLDVYLRADAGLTYSDLNVGDYDLGGFICGMCPCSAGKEISLGALKSLNIIQNTEIERLDSIKINDINLKEISSVLAENFAFRFNKHLKSLKV